MHDLSVTRCDKLPAVLKVHKQRKVANLHMILPAAKLLAKKLVIFALDAPPAIWAAELALTGCLDVAESEDLKGFLGIAWSL